MMKVQEMSIDEIKPYENNPRINDNGVNAVANSIKEFGWKQPIVVDKDNVIIVGHTRYLASKKYNFEHWHIAVDGVINDAFKKLTTVFECLPVEFLNAIQNESGNNSYQYYKQWKDRIDKVQYNNLGFSNFSVIKDFCNKVPENSIVHASVLNAIRISNYFGFKDSVKCYANVGADGIDGALSTFIGEANATDKLSFLLIGDLSFLYDLNSIDYVDKNNMRILVINNYAGAEFYKNFGLKMIPTLDKHVAARHHTKIKNAILSKNVEYIKAENQEELNDGLKKLVGESDKPIILEVFTDANTDASTLKKFWSDNRIENSQEKVKKILKKVLSKEQMDKLKRILKR